MNRRGSFTFGVLLVLAGAWFLVVQFIPALDDWVTQIAGWPALVIVPGLIFLAVAVISGVSGFAVPGAIISGVGGILYYQNNTGDWQSWAYMWALIVVSVGVGVFIMHLLDGRPRKAFDEGGSTILTGLVMFLIFGTVFRVAFGQEPFFGDYWPVMLIAAGLWFLICPYVRPAKKRRVVVTTPGGESVFEDTGEEDAIEEEAI